MSKRDPETIVEPVEFARQIAEAAGADFEVGVDALRYYSLREVTFGSDGDFSREGCLSRYNSDLANGLGNLVQRAVSMLSQYFESVVPEGGGDLGLQTTAIEAAPRVAELYEKLDFSNALNEIFLVVSQANRTIEEQKPWAQIKNCERESVANLLRELLAVCQFCAIAMMPIMPHSSRRLLELLNLPTETKWENATDFSTLLTSGHRCLSPKALFPRIKNLEEAITNITTDMTTESANEMAPNQNQLNAVDASTPVAPVAEIPVEAPAETPQVKEESNVITYEDFAKVEFRVGKVLEAERVPKADKLLRLQVDLGTETRQILAGIAEQFEPESLIGKNVVVVANLAPRKLRGFESQGMILAASTPDGPPLGLVTIDADVPPGSVVK